MITTLSAYKEMMVARSGGESRQLPKGQKVATADDNASAPLTGQAGQIPAEKVSDAVSVELSASHDVFTAVDNFFNLGGSGRFGAFHKLSPEDKEQFVKIVAELAKSGYMGYEELVVDKKVERHELTNQIGDHRLHNARVYDDPKNKRH